MICRICREDRPKADFYKGVSSMCKGCFKMRMKIRRLTNPAVQAYDRLRSSTPKRMEAIAKNCARWRKAHPEAYRAQNAVNNAVRDGKLEKRPCAICGATKVHAHHKDYSKPLDVTWLCAKCHQRLHVSFPELGGNYHPAPAAN